MEMEEEYAVVLDDVLEWLSIRPKTESELRGYIKKALEHYDFNVIMNYLKADKKITIDTSSSERIFNITEQGKAFIGLHGGYHRIVLEYSNNQRSIELATEALKISKETKTLTEAGIVFSVKSTVAAIIAAAIAILTLAYMILSPKF